MVFRLRSILVPVLVLTAACPKKDQGRPPGDVCGGLAHLPDCTLAPEDHAPEGFSSAANCYDVGRQQFNCGLFDEAVKSLQHSADLKSDPKTWHALGEALYVQEKWSSARDAFQKAVEADPHKRDSWIRLGQANTLGNQFDAAHAAFAHATELGPKKPDAYRLDAEALTQAGKLDEAVAQLKKAEKLGDAANETAVVQQEVQVLELKQRRAEKAKDDEGIIAASTELAAALQRGTQLTPGNAEVFRQLAEARLNSGDLESAEQALDQATKLDAKDFVSPRMAAVLKEKRGDGAGARASVALSLKVQPKQTVPYLVLGRLDLAGGDAKKALEDFNQALTNLDGKDPIEILELATLGEKLGKSDKAEELYSTLETDPEQSTKLDFWLGEARLAQLNKHPDRVKTACAKAKSLVANAECPPPAAPH